MCMIVGSMDILGMEHFSMESVGIETVGMETGYRRTCWYGKLLVSLMT